MKAPHLPGLVTPSPTRDTSWIEPLKDAIRDMLGSSLSSITPDQRYLLARYHVWRWANCKVSERVNRSKASSVAAGIANLGNDRRFGALTVRDYVAHAEVIWKERGESPWFKPWDITARVQFEDGR